MGTTTHHCRCRTRHRPYLQRLRPQGGVRCRTRHRLCLQRLRRHGGVVVAPGVHTMGIARHGATPVTTAGARAITTIARPQDRHLCGSQAVGAPDFPQWVSAPAIARSPTLAVGTSGFALSTEKPTSAPAIARIAIPEQVELGTALARVPKRREKVGT